MFDILELKKAVRIQQRTYRLLKWMVNSLIDKGFVPSKKVHEYGSSSEAAYDWIEKNYVYMPPDVCPESLDKDEIQAYANVFSSYLLTSFDIDQRSQFWTKSYDGCYCPMCTYLVSAPHLKRKKLKKEDKIKAKELKISYLEQLSIELNQPVNYDNINEIVDDLEWSEILSMATYGDQLILRVKGHVEGPALLSLWREFAWINGAPKKKYKLDAKDIIQCEERLKNRLETFNKR